MQTPETCAYFARVLALDISTNVCGVAILDIWQDGSVVVHRFGAVDAASRHAAQLRGMGKKKGNSEDERFGRIRCASVDVRWMLQDATFDHLAYEVPNQRGAGATAAIWQAIGAVLERAQPTPPVPLLPIHASTAKAVVGTQKVRAEGESADSLDEKGRAVEWLIDTLLVQSNGDVMVAKLRTMPKPEQEAIADAVAVGVATVPVLLPGVQSICDRRKTLPKKKRKAARSVARKAVAA